MRRNVFLLVAASLAAGLSMPVSESKKLRDYRNNDPKRAGRLPRGLSTRAKTHTCHKRTPVSIADFAARDKAELRQFEKRQKREENRKRSMEGQKK